MMVLLLELIRLTAKPPARQLLAISFVDAGDNRPKNVAIFFSETFCISVSFKIYLHYNKSRRLKNVSSIYRS